MNTDPMNTDPMTVGEKKQAWQLLGRAIDDAGAAGVPAEAFLTRLALLCALELPSLERTHQIIALAHEAGRADVAPDDHHC